MEFFLNKNGGVNLFYGGHVFVRQNSRNDTIWWRCERYRKTGCRRRLITINGKLKESENRKEINLVHNH